MALNFLSNGIFAGDVTIPGYIYHTGDSNTFFGFNSSDQWKVTAGGNVGIQLQNTGVYLYYGGNEKLRTTSTGISVTGTATATTFSGAVSTGNADGQGNIPFKLSVDYNSYMVAAAGTTWGLFWAGNSGARYGTNGNGGPGNIWGNSNNPNEFVFVGGDNTRWTVNGNTGDTWQSGDIYVGGGDIILSGLGRIQGVDTVSVNTDAANKLYVDNAVAASPQGTVTISGTPVNNQLAVWTSATSIEGEAELTYDGNTFTVGGTGNTTTFLDVIGTNTAGAPATAAAIRIYGYEGRGEGIFYYDSDYAAAEWYSGIPYGGGNTYQIGYDATGGQAQYTANAVITMDASKNTFFAGNVDLGDSSNITMATGAPGQLRIKGSGYSGAIALDATAMYIYHDSSLRDLVLGTNEVARLTIDGSSGNATFAGGLTIPDYINHTGDSGTYFGFSGNDIFQVNTAGGERMRITASGMKLSTSGATVSVILDEDSMSSNSATALATQQSIKQYVDTAVSNAGNVTTGGFTSGRVPFANSSVNLDNSANLTFDGSALTIGQPTHGYGTLNTGGQIYIEHQGTAWNETSPGTQRGAIHMDPVGSGANDTGNAITFGASDHSGGTVGDAGIYVRSDGNYGTKMYIATTDSYAVGSKTAITILQNGSVTINRSHLTISTITNSSSDTDKFLVSNNGQVQYRTGDQVRSDIGAGRVDTVSDDGGSTINVSGSSTARTVAAVTGAVSSSSANLATGAQIQTAINTAIGTIPSGLAFEGNWDASSGSAPSSSPVNGQFWIVTVAGSTNLSGITDWEIGDWAIYVATGAGTDGWQKVDNSSTLSGEGVATQLTYWTDTSNVAGDGGLTYDASANKLTVAGNLSAAGYNIFGLGLSTGSWYGDLGSNGYTRETGLTMTAGSEFVVVSKGGQGSVLVDGAYLAYESNNGFFGSYNSAYGNLTGIRATAANTLTVMQLDGGTANLSITSIANVTTDTDKFLVSDSGVVKYRTGAQVLSDIGGQASGNYLPVANPTFTGTLTGPVITTTGTATIGGATLSGDTFSDPDLLLSILSNDTTASIRNKISSSTSLTKVTDSTAPAPGVFQVSGAYNIQFGDYHTIDEGDTFTFEFWYKWHSGDSTYNLLYAGSSFFNAAGSYLGNNQRYWGEAALNINANSGSDWYHVTGTLGPARGSNTGQIPTTAVSMQLLFLFNYAPNGTSVTRYCGLKVYKSGQTVTQLYRKTLGSEASTTRNRDLVVDQNGDLYGSNLTITGNLIGNTANTTELGTYSTGAIKRIRMCQGGELHFGDTTTAAPLGITEGDWNQFADQDRLSIYGRNSIKFYAGSIASSLKATLQSTGLTLNTITNATSDTDKFLVSDSGIIKYRTGAQVLSDIGAASSGSLGNYLPLTGGTMSGTIVSTATTALEMDGAADAQGVLMQADSSGTYPVFLRAANPASGGETSAWLFKEASAPWGIWHNNPVNSFDWTRSGNNLGIANNVGGQTNSVMIRLNSTDGSGTFAGNVVSSGDVTADQFFSTNNGNGQNYKIGDDCWIGDINVANTFRVQGNQDSSKGYITFGSNNAQLGRDGTGALTWGGDFEVTGYATITGNATVNGRLKVANYWDSGTLANNAIYAQNTTDGFAFGVGSDISTWFAWDSTQGQNDMISVANDGSKVTIHENLYLGNVDTSSNGTSALVLNSSGTNEVEKRTLGTGAFGPTPVGAYLPLAGGTLTGGLVGLYSKFTQGVFDDSSGIRILNPGGGSRTTQTSSTTGAIKITLPVSWTNTMMRITVKVYEYTTNESFTAVFGGYNYSPNASWYNEFAYIESSARTDRNFTVRFGHDGSKCCVYIGELTSAWTYTQVFVTDVQVGYSGLTASQWRSGWNVGFESSAFGTITQTETGTQVNNWARNGQDLSYTSGSGNVTVPALTTTGNLTVGGNSVLGNASGDYVHVNDILHVGAIDSGDADFYFGEGSTGAIAYGVHWDWDSLYTFTWNTRNNNTDTALMSYVTNDLTKVQWFRNFDMNNNKITELATPTATTDAANKAYVDASIPSLANYVTLNTAQTISGAKTITGITQFNEHTQHGDQVQARWGAGNDLAIFHNGTNNYIASTAKDMYYTGSAVTGTSAYSQIFKQTNFNGGDEEYLRISGPTRQVLFSRDAKFIDGIKCTFGTSATSSPGDLEIYHDGTNSIIENTTGDLYIINESLDKDVIIQSDNGATGQVVDYFRADGSVGNSILYGNYGTRRLETTSTGVTITGILSGLTNPTAAQDAATKDYVDTATGGAMTGFGVSNLPSGTGSTFTITNGQTVGIIGGTNIQSVVSTANETITLNYTGGTGSGSVTSVATGAGLTGGTITGSGTVSVDYAGSDSIVMAAPGGSTPDGDDYMIYGSDSSDDGSSKNVQFVDIPLSILDNDAGFTSNTGTVTSVATGSGLAGGTITGSGTLSVDSTVIRTTGSQTITGNKEFAPSSTSTSYTHAAVELRESNYSGSSGAPPRISWHWGGVVASSMTIESNGTIAVRNNPGNAYERFACGNLTAHGGTFLLGSGGVGDMYLGNQSTGNYFRFHTNNSQTYFDMNCGQINWRQGSSTRFYFYPSTANMTINGTLTQNSDSRVKENVVEIDNCISKVQAMRGVYYNRTDFNTEATKVGVIAQEVEAVLPELILEASDTGLKSVAYAELTAVLINAIKEQQEIIEDLKTRITKLEK